MRLYKTILSSSAIAGRSRPPDPKRTQFTNTGVPSQEPELQIRLGGLLLNAARRRPHRGRAGRIQDDAEQRQLALLGLLGAHPVDGTYLSRFWTQFEAWLDATIELQAEEPLRSATVQEKRYFIECLHSGDAKYEGRKLEDVWGPANLEFACRYLQMDDVMVTNKSDKEQQILKLKEQFDKLGEEEYRAKLAKDEAHLKRK